MSSVTVDGYPMDVTEKWSPMSFAFVSGGYTANREFDVVGAPDGKRAVMAVGAYDSTCNGNATHPYNNYLICTGRTAARPSLNVWKVTVPYQSTPAGWHPDPGAPLTDPIRYTWELGLFSEAVDRTTGGNLITNAAGEPFSQSPNGEFQAVRITALRNEAFFNSAVALDFGNSVNNANVGYKSGAWSVEKGQSKVCTITPVTELTQYSPFVAVRYVIELRPGFVKDSDDFWDGFKQRVLNQGRRGWYMGGGSTPRRGDIVKTVDSGVIEPAGIDVLLDSTGKPLQSEWKIRKVTSLDGLGVATPIANPNTMPSDILIETTSFATFLKFYPQGIKLRDHSSLGL